MEENTFFNNLSKAVALNYDYTSSSSEILTASPSCSLLIVMADLT
jgi:hypothetical protein